MNYDELMWKDDAQAFIEMLCEGCAVKPPRLSFTGRNRRRGTYQPRHKTIRVAKWTHTWILTHEFAHYLDHVESGRSDARQANDREWHSQGFYYKLRRLTRMLGGKYPWHREYKQLARWAKTEGLM